MTARSLALAVTLAVLAAAPGTAPAEDGRAAVYDPLPPAGSAYVRFVNALGGEVSLAPDFLPAQRLGTEPVLRLGAQRADRLVLARQGQFRTGKGARQGSLDVRVHDDPAVEGYP